MRTRPKGVRGPGGGAPWSGKGRGGEGPPQAQPRSAEGGHPVLHPLRERTPGTARDALHLR
ncbi:hypothetical protein CGL27_28245 [Streptomyces sp. 11-1-2]|nr:hypothetical protein CGL27_28245 [Streptomyces sp. 11-1-2]